MSIINNEKDTKDYIKNYTTTKPNELDWTKKDQKDWEKFKKKLPNLLQEAVIFGVGASVFLLIFGYLIFKILEGIYN